MWKICNRKSCKINALVNIFQLYYSSKFDCTQVFSFRFLNTFWTICFSPLFYHLKICHFLLPLSLSLYLSIYQSIYLYIPLSLNILYISLIPLFISLSISPPFFLPFEVSILQSPCNHHAILKCWLILFIYKFYT